MPLPTRLDDLALAFTITDTQWDARISETERQKLILFGINALVNRPQEVTVTNTVKVTGALTDEQLRASPVEVTGTTVAIINSLPLPTGAATESGVQEVVAALGGIQSVQNTTTTPLGSNATYTGTFEQNDYSGVMVSCTTDVAGILYFDFSVDGTNVSTFPVGGFHLTAGIHEFHTAIKGPRFFRARIVNGSGAQSYLRLYTYYGTFGSPNAPLSATIGEDADAAVVRDTTSILDISKGLISGSTNERKLGYNPDIASTEEDIWVVGGTYTGFITAPDNIRIKAGGNPNDTAAGTGARSVTVQFLNANYEFTEEVLATAGASASASTASTAIRFIRAFVTDVGTYHSNNAGNITFETTAGGAVVGRIATGIGRTQLAVYTVPAGYTIYIYRWIADVDSQAGKEADVFLWRVPEVNDVTAPFRGKQMISRFTQVSGHNEKDLPYLSYEEKTDIWVSAIGPAGGTAVASSFHFILVKNS